MSDMVRKQIYIHKRQEVELKRLAKNRGQSEAEIIRQAIDREAELSQTSQAMYDPSAWIQTLQLIETRKQIGKTGEPYRWNRQELYAEREQKWGLDTDPIR